MHQAEHLVLRPGIGIWWQNKALLCADPELGMSQDPPSSRQPAVQLEMPHTPSCPWLQTQLSGQHLLTQTLHSGGAVLHGLAWCCWALDLCFGASPSKAVSGLGLKFTFSIVL